MVNSQTVSTSSIIAVCITLFISLFLPLIIYVIYGLKNKGKGVWTAWLLGAAGFYIAQVVIRTPILRIMSSVPGFSKFATGHYVLYCLIMALTAGLFEVAARYVVARIMSKNLTFEKGIAAGLGHGGIEAMVLVGLTYINNLVYIGMINSGTYDSVLEQVAGMGADTSVYLQVKEALISSSAGIFLLAGYERILTMIFQVALSLAVCYFVSRKKTVQGILICLLCHWFVDFVTPMINGMANGYLGQAISVTTAYIIAYVFLTAVAVASVFGIICIKKRWQKEAPVEE